MEGEQKQYQDLEERTFLFAQKTRDYIQVLPKSLSHIEYGKQLLRSSGSVAANYIEANECISKKDFYHRIKICRKEAKESRMWLRLTKPAAFQESVQQSLIQEALELTKIFSSMVAKNNEQNKH